MFIEEVSKSLSEHGVRYALVGGYAVALHGAVRGTMDIDIVLSWELAALRKAARALESIGLESRLPVTAEDVFQFRDEYVRNRNLVAWNFFDPNDVSRQVDIIIVCDLKGKKRKKILTAAGPLYVLDREELIRMKREAGRPQDLADVDALERLQ